MRILFLVSLTFGIEINDSNKKKFQKWNTSAVKTSKATADNESAVGIQSITESENLYSIKRYNSRRFQQGAGEIEAGEKVFYEITFEEDHVVFVDGVAEDPDDIFLYIVSYCKAGDKIIFQVKFLTF